MPATAPPASAAQLIRSGREVVVIEAAAVAALAARLNETFAAACGLLLACRGRVVTTGMGKSGHIARKVAATLASTGSPAFYVHPGEASHGDLGMITGEDVLIAVSHSGETPEVLAILSLLKRLGAGLIALTGNPASTLARAADCHLDVAVSREACPLNLAPTASTSAALAMGDALALAVSAARGFTAEDFARAHPGGNLGRRLLLRVADLMHRGEAIPLVGEAATLREALVEMSAKGLGMTLVTDSAGQLLGLFTDGDLRRSLDQGAGLASPIADLMTRECTVAAPEMLAGEVLRLMDRRRINGMPVVADGRLVGVFNMHDLLQAGVV
ncbi:MAG TPA: KpsF/GutQ family sugar-phosphate isomerase [Gammaproteobacteria bacterium]|nr:KpsF/GutQ family sugar-phosphate isomerase [Gammaproteobacteria bacterium]